jgi:membrane-associated protein
MNYARFVSFNVFGGVGWVFGMTMLGYLLGGVPIVKQHLEKVILLIILISVAPVVVEAVKAYRKQKLPVL